MYEQQAERFFSEAADAFLYLEETYSFRRVSNVNRSNVDPRDAMIASRYVSDKIGVEISWYFTDAVISVALLELKETNVFPDEISFFLGKSGTANAISIYTLAEVKDMAKDPRLLLDIDSVKLSVMNKRKIIINNNLHGVLMGLASILREIADDILKGDTRIFPVVMEYFKRKTLKILGN